MNNIFLHTYKPGAFRMPALAFTAILAAALLMVSCGKKESDPAPSGSNNNGGGSNLSHRMQVITGNTWKITAARMSPSMGGSDDYYAMMEACSKDNTFKFTNDASKTLVIDEGASKCSGKPQTTNDTWGINSNETVLTIGNATHKIVAFIDNQFETETTYSHNGMTMTVSYRFSAQ